MKVELGTAGSERCLVPKSIDPPEKKGIPDI